MTAIFVTKQYTIEKNIYFCYMEATINVNHKSIFILPILMKSMRQLYFFVKHLSKIVIFKLIHTPFSNNFTKEFKFYKLF